MKCLENADRVRTMLYYTSVIQRDHVLNTCWKWHVLTSNTRSMVRYGECQMTVHPRTHLLQSHQGQTVRPG